jgi:hypothetical protein
MVKPRTNTIRAGQSAAPALGSPAQIGACVTKDPMRPPRSNLDLQDPGALLARVEADMALIPNGKLFNAPASQALFDGWCAGSFGIGYRKNVASCEVAVSEPGSGEDFFLHAQDCYFPFETTEVLEPGRRRGDEYRKPPRSAPYAPGAAAADGLRWLEAGVQIKVDKHYDQSSDLNLLVYADFTVDELQWSHVRNQLVKFRGCFGSLWVMAYHAIGTVFSNPELGSVGDCNGWGQLRVGPDWKPDTLSGH